MQSFDGANLSFMLIPPSAAEYLLIWQKINAKSNNVERRKCFFVPGITIYGHAHIPPFHTCCCLPCPSLLHSPPRNKGNQVQSSILGVFLWEILSHWPGLLTLTSRVKIVQKQRSAPKVKKDWKLTSWAEHPAAATSQEKKNESQDKENSWFWKLSMPE